MKSDSIVSKAVKYSRAVPKWIGRIANVTFRCPHILAGDFKYIFILSHMRGYTSLLSHILGSHPEIAGYFELHQSYRKSFDLILMSIRVADSLDYRVDSRYLLDKILYSHLSLSPDLLKREDVFSIFMVRRPEETLKSLMTMRRFRLAPEEALPYYIERLECMKDLSTIPCNRIYIDAETLIEFPENTLEFIGSYLHLQEKIFSTYSIFKLTGQQGYGDQSKYIRKGVIIKKRDTHDKNKIPAADFQDATKAYDEIRQVLRENCQTNQRRSL